MISNYINKVVVSAMTFSEFKEAFEGNLEIGRHRLTLREAYKELDGGKDKPESKKPETEKKKGKKKKDINNTQY